MTGEAKPGRRGRPSKPDAVRLRKPVAVRLREELKADLTISAAKHGRSISEEIEAQLEASLAVKQYLIADWGFDVFWIARALAASISQIERVYESSWHDSEKTSEIAALTAAEIVANYKAAFSGDTEAWLAIGAKGAADPRDAKDAREAAVIFAARDMTSLPRIKRDPDPTS